MTREDTIREARRLRQTMSATDVGRALGVSPSTVRNWCLGGDCARCGRAVEGSSGHASLYCAPCNGTITARRRRGTGPLGLAALAFLSEQRQCKDVARHLGCSYAHAANLLHRLVRYGLIRRVGRGLYERIPA